MFTMQHLIFRLALVLIISSTCGCGGEVRRAAVSGTITVDGTPLTKGSIAFVPSGENKGPAAGAKIINGSYVVAQEKGPFIGTNRVMITSIKPSGRMVPDIENPGGPPIAEISQFIPARYNDESLLERDVAKGKNEFHFELELEPAE